MKHMHRWIVHIKLMHLENNHHFKCQQYVWFAPSSAVSEINTDAVSRSAEDLSALGFPLLSVCSDINAQVVCAYD